ncbi:MAG: alcohol dehydrogenase catalytic domain-containing protein, partial [Verrucomicrobia bacterium]|nr:alcohol dehydrogenase catalytic domain-containing protein [Verrucomicrobiota bacterium]
MKSIQLTGYGKPHEVVKLIDVQDVGTPGPDEIIIDVEAAPIEPSDLYMIAGVYGNLPPLPHILGIQGVGRVAAKGRSVKHLKEGDRTMTPLFVPSWVDRVKTTASYLRPLPEGDVNQLAMLGINPATAYLLVTEYVQLKPGEWLLQNAANSSVGRAVIAIAKARGIKTVNIVRRAELIDEIKALGGDVVLVDGPDLP